MLTATHGNFHAKILADSISPTKSRLTTFELTFPRIVLSELNTHKVLSKNSSSSRAIPVTVQIKKILEHPFIPESFGVNEPGMQASATLEREKDIEEAVRIWKHSRNNQVLSATELILGEKETQKALGQDYWKHKDIFDNMDMRLELISALDEYVKYSKECRESGIAQDKYLNIHKQIANRCLEQFAWHVVIITGTQWDNYWALRTSENAQPEIKTISQMAQSLYNESTPELKSYGQWHLPLLQEDEKDQALVDPDYWLKVVVGRCARVSYETHDGKRNPNADVALYEKLVSEGHMSPLEHIGRPLHMKAVEVSLGSGLVAKEQWSGNFLGWEQLRKTVEYEDDYSKVLSTLSSKENKA